MRVDHLALLKQMQSRQAALEESNAEMTKALAEQTRNATASKSANGMVERELLAEKEAEAESLQRKLVQASVVLDEEKSHCSKISQDLRLAQLEHKQLLQALEEEKQHANRRAITLEEKLRDALQKVAGAGGGGGEEVGRGVAWHSPFRGSGGKDDRGEEELRSLTKQLLKRQGLVLELQAERAALASKVQDLSTHCKAQDHKIALLSGELEGAINGGENDGLVGNEEEEGMLTSIESGGGYYGNRIGGSVEGGLLRNRRGGGGVRGRKVMNDLEKLGVRAGPNVTHAVNVIDNLTLETGNFFRLYPLVRMLFVFYLLVLHLWVLVVLTYSLPA